MLVSRAPRRGQASLEMVVAMSGALLLFLGCLKIFVWISGALINGQQRYDASRAAAASGDPNAAYEPAAHLDLFH